MPKMNKLSFFLFLFIYFFFFFLFPFSFFFFLSPFFLSLLITLPQSGTCNRLWIRTLELRAVPQSRLTSSLHNECASRCTDESIYSEVGQTRLNTWQKLQQFTPSGFACMALLEKLKLQPTYLRPFLYLQWHSRKQQTVPHPPTPFKYFRGKILLLRQTDYRGYVISGL